MHEMLRIWLLYGNYILHVILFFMTDISSLRLVIVRILIQKCTTFVCTQIIFLLINLKLMFK